MIVLSVRDEVIAAANKVILDLIEEFESPSKRRMSCAQWERVAEEARALKRYAHEYLTTDEDRLRDLEKDIPRLEHLRDEAAQKIKELKKKMGEAG